MKTKKKIVAFAICFSMLFVAQATNIIVLNEQETKIKKSDITRVPGKG